MTKTKTSPATAPMTVDEQLQLNTIHFMGPVLEVLAEATVFIRQGYAPAMDMPADMFIHNGYLSFTLVRGDPSPRYYSIAAASEAEALETLRRFNDKAAFEALQKQQQEAAAIAAKRAELEIAIATHELQLSALKESLNAA